MSLKDNIHISHIGDVFDDKKALVRKLTLQHKCGLHSTLRGLGDLCRFVPHPSPTILRLFEPLFEKLDSEYHRIYQDDTEIDDKITKNLSYYLAQNKDYNAPFWHDHVPRTDYVYDEFTKTDNGAIIKKSVRKDLKMLVSCVYYLQLPEESGAIQFKDEEEEIELMPSEGDLIFFPYDMLHKPTVSKCIDYRISFNINVAQKTL